MNVRRHEGAAGNRHATPSSFRLLLQRVGLAENVPDYAVEPFIGGGDAAGMSIMVLCPSMK